MTQWRISMKASATFLAAFALALSPLIVAAEGPLVPPTRAPGPPPGVTRQSDELPVLRQPGPAVGGIPGPVASTRPAGTIVLPSPPPATRSFYMTRASITNAVALAEGGIQGTNDINNPPGAEGNAAILDFGAPAFVGGLYGTYRPTTAMFVSITDIERIVELYAEGYIDAGGNSPSLNIIVGVNNDTLLTGTNLVSHAREWARMISRVNSYFGVRGWSSQLRAQAGADIETEYNTPSITRQWVDAFTAEGLGWRIYNFGNATCPVVGDGTINQPCDSVYPYGWKMEDIWYLSWGNRTSFAFPEIYNSANAQQWYLLSLYGLRSKNGAWIYFSGTLTQQGACQQNPIDPSCPTNSPSQGWQQLMDALFQSGAPPELRHTILWSSDIRFE